MLRRSVVGAAGVASLLAAEVAWVVHRDLPSCDGVDASGTYRPVVGSSAGRPLVLVAMGDSTLTGPGLDHPRDLWLWQALDAIAPAATIDVHSFARGGARVADVRQRLGAPLAVGADVALLAVGSNDAIHGTRRRPFARDLEAVVRELTVAVPIVAIANVGDLGNLERVPRPLSWVLRARARTMRREIETVVARHPSAVLLDVAASDAGFRRGGVFVADRFHPNAAGHLLWAQCAIPALTVAVDRPAHGHAVGGPVG